MDIKKLLTKGTIDTAVDVLLQEQRRCGGTIPLNFYTNIQDGLRDQGIVISRMALYQRVSRRANAKPQQKSPTVNPSPPTAEVTFDRQIGTPSSASAASSITVQKRCVEWMGRISPSQSFDDDEENNVADDDDADADTVVNEDVVASVLFDTSNTTVDVNPEAEDENAVAVAAM